MTVLFDWARQEGIPFEAIRRLQVLLGTVDLEPATGEPGRSEASVSAAVELRASQLGGVLWRNQVGAAFMQDGTFLRFGIANESEKMNKRIKSSDRIGIRPTLIEQHHVGSIFGKFWCREVKKRDWVYTGTERELAQLKFLELVISMGGDAAFINDEAQL